MGRRKARAIGINHVSLKVDNVDDALAFYGRFLEFELRSKNEAIAFIDLGDQFIALSTGRDQSRDDERHFGLVVDDVEAVQASLRQLGVEVVSECFFYDPWGNRIEIVGYETVQFMKAGHVLCRMNLQRLHKTPGAIAELAAKGLHWSDAADTPSAGARSARRPGARYQA